MNRRRRLFPSAMVALALLLSACGDDDAPVSAKRGGASNDLTVVSLNILHGINCPAPSQCRLSDRIELLFQWITRAGCPDVVTLQEISRRARDMIGTRLATACPFAYHEVYFPTTLRVDDEMMLSRYPIVQAEIAMLFGDFRSLLWARIDHPIGPVDVFSTHLSSSSDEALAPCSAPACPAACLAAGAINKRDCQAVQVRQLVETKHERHTPAVITGDFNEHPGSFVYRQLVERGWHDVHLAAGNPECDSSRGEGCTAGREDENLTELESPALNQSARIDFIFLVPARAPSTCRNLIDSHNDGDGDGLATGRFAGTPNPFAPNCGAAPLPICWPSDHNGVQLDLNCD